MANLGPESDALPSPLLLLPQKFRILGESDIPLDKKTRDPAERDRNFFKKSCNCILGTGKMITVPLEAAEAEK